MATLFKNKLYQELGSDEVTLLTTEANAKTTVIGLSFTNLTGGIVLANVRIEDTVALTTAYYIKDVIIPPGQSLRVINGGEKLILGPQTRVIVRSNATDCLDVVMSYVEIV
jgi:hypothetical protein